MSKGPKGKKKMTYKISQIPVHDNSPAGTNMLESEQAGGTSVYSTIDEVLNPVMPAVTQLQGYTIANVAEVEAATKALRAMLRAEDIAFGADAVFAVSRHMLGAQCAISATTQALTFAAGTGTVLGAVWGFNGLALLKKCTVSVVTSAVSGARLGNISCRLHRNWPAINTVAVTSDILPPIGPAGGGGVGAMLPSSNYNTMNIQQAQPLMVVSIGSAAASIVTGGIESSKALGVAMGGAQSAVGQNIPPTTIFDCVGGGYEPYVMIANTGFNVTLDVPAAVTSQTLSVSVNLQWDEWIPIHR